MAENGISESDWEQIQRDHRVYEGLEPDETKELLFRVALSPERQAINDKEYRRTDQELISIETEKKAAAAEFNGSIKQLKEEKKRIDRELESGMQEVRVMTRSIPLLKLGILETVALPSFRPLYSRPLTDAQRKAFAAKAEEDAVKDNEALLKQNQLPIPGTEQAPAEPVKAVSIRAKQIDRAVNLGTYKGRTALRENNNVRRLVAEVPPFGPSVWEEWERVWRATFSQVEKDLVRAAYLVECCSDAPAVVLPEATAVESDDQQAPEPSAEEMQQRLSQMEQLGRLHGEKAVLLNKGKKLEKAPQLKKGLRKGFDKDVDRTLTDAEWEAFVESFCLACVEGFEAKAAAGAGEDATPVTTNLGEKVKEALAKGEALKPATPTTGAPRCCMAHHFGNSLPEQSHSGPEVDCEPGCIHDQKAVAKAQQASTGVPRATIEVKCPHPQCGTMVIARVDVMTDGAEYGTLDQHRIGHAEGAAKCDASDCQWPTQELVAGTVAWTEGHEDDADPVQAPPPAFIDEPELRKFGHDLGETHLKSNGGHQHPAWMRGKFPGASEKKQVEAQFGRALRDEEWTVIAQAHDEVMCAPKKERKPKITEAQQGA